MALAQVTASLDCAALLDAMRTVVAAAVSLLVARMRCVMARQRR